MTIIVTGGAGFIGSNFVFHMLKEHPDYRIVCLDKLTYAGNLSTLAPVMDNPNFRFVKADICDREAVYKLFEEEHPDMVVNFAAPSLSSAARYSESTASVTPPCPCPGRFSACYTTSRLRTQSPARRPTPRQKSRCGPAAA